MRKVVGLAVVALAIAATGCGSNNNPAKDGRVTPKKEASVPPGLEAGTPGLEASVKKDKGTAPGAEAGGSTCGAPKKATVNSGASCSATCKKDTDCKTTGQKCVNDSTGAACAATDTACSCACPTGEHCVAYKNAAGKDVAQCLGECCADPNLSLDDPANVCPVPDSKTQFATCLWQITGKNYMTCAILCSISDSTGKVYTWTCPDPTNQDCIVDDPKYPDDKYCVPKI